MLTISEQNRGFIIKASDPGSGLRGWSIRARDRKEMLLAVEHYYALHMSEHKRKCPLCRQAKERELNLSTADILARIFPTDPYSKKKKA